MLLRGPASGARLGGQRRGGEQQQRRLPERCKAPLRPASSSSSRRPTLPLCQAARLHSSTPQLRASSAANAAFVGAFVGQSASEQELQQALSEPPSSWLEESPLATEAPPTFVTAPGRVVAIGDLHGSWAKAVESLQAAGVIRITRDEEIVWTGEDTTVVQLGDVMDRGDYEIAIVNLLRGLDQQARQQGGAVYMLNGNHESLNVCGDFRYVTPGAFVESGMFAGLSEEQLSDWELLAHVRFAVYKPGGPMAVELAKNPTVLVVNDTVFAHGGLLPVHVNYGVEKLNREVAAWMRGDRNGDGSKAPPPLLAMGDGASIMWNRQYSRERFPSPLERTQAASNLKQVLARLEAKRMVVGHTPQLGGVNCELDGTVWRVDVGMSAGVLNRPVQVLEIDRSPLSSETMVRVIHSPPSWGAAGAGGAARRALDEGFAMMARA